MQNEIDEETRVLKEAEKRMKMATEATPLTSQPSVPSELKRDENVDQKIVFSFGKFCSIKLKKRFCHIFKLKKYKYEF